MSNDYMFSHEGDYPPDTETSYAHAISMSHVPLAPLKRLLVSEVYGPVIQGEGGVAGIPTVFVRLGGCDFRCSWCDSLYAVLPEHKGAWEKLTAEEVYRQIHGLTSGEPILVTLSGGNPALQDCSDLIAWCRQGGYTTAIETQGTKAPEWLSMVNSVTISPKGPSSGMGPQSEQYWTNLQACIDRVDPTAELFLKVVVFNRDDYAFAREVWRRCYVRRRVEGFYLQAGTLEPYQDTTTPERLAVFRDNILTATERLSSWVIDDRWYNVRVLPQIHALINGSKRGV